MILIAFIGVLILTIFSAHPRRLAADSNSLCFFDMIYPLHSCVNLALKGHAITSFHNTKTFIQVSQIHSLTSYYATSAGASRRARTFDLTVNSRLLCQLSYRGINHEGGNPHIIYGLDAFGQFCRIFHHHHVSHASTALFYGAVCNALFRLSPFLLIGGDSISSEKIEIQFAKLTAYLYK